MLQTRLRKPIVESDHGLGPRGAPVTLVEYGDYQCPSCGRAYPVTRRVQRALGQSLRFIYRHFPMDQLHPHSLNAARVAEAAALQGRFWEMHHTLFTRQDFLDMESLYDYAANLRLDLDRFERDMRSAKVTARIESDLEGGIRSGVNRTPTFFINGVRFDGDWEDYGFLDALRRAESTSEAVY